MDFGLAFTFPFKDPDWFKKIAIIGLVGLIPIIGQLVLFGWAFQIAQRVIRGEHAPLPELDFGEQLTKGFQTWLIYLVYALPIIIITIPLAVVDSLAATANGSNDSIILALSLCCGAVIFLYGIFMAFVVPAAIGRFADKGNFGAAFQFANVFALVRSAPAAYLMVLLGYLLSGLIAPAGSILCVIGVVLTLAYAQAVTFHLTGQAYRQAAR
jgi:hypothetical protein